MRDSLRGAHAHLYCGGNKGGGVQGRWPFWLLVGFLAWGALARISAYPCLGAPAQAVAKSCALSTPRDSPRLQLFFDISLVWHHAIKAQTAYD